MKKPHLLNDEIDEVALVDDAKTERPVVGTLTSNAGSIWVLMRILHVFDQGFTPENDFVAYGARGGGGTPYHEGRVLLQNTKVQLKLLSTEGDEGTVQRLASSNITQTLKSKENFENYHNVSNKDITAKGNFVFKINSLINEDKYIHKNIL